MTGALTLTPTYESVGVRFSYSGDDDDDGTATLQWKKSSSETWLAGPTLIKDTRAEVTQLGDTYPNAYRFEYRASLVGMSPATSYDVLVKVTDPDDVTGTNPVTGTVSTWTETGQIPSNGTTYWVATGGDDSNNGLSPNTAFATIQHATDIVNPGDTVIVRDGTYREHVRITRSGASGNYIHVKAENKWQAAWMGPEGSDRTNRLNRLVVTDASFLRIDGFYFDAVDTNSAVSISEGSTDVIVENNYVTNFNGEHEDEAPGTDTGNNTPSGEGYGIHIGGGLDSVGSTSSSTVARITVQDNEVVVTERQLLEHGGIESSTTNDGNHVIRRNKITIAYGPNTFGQDHGEDCIHHRENSQNDPGFNDTDIHDNVCVNSTDDGLELDAAGVNLRVWGNTVYGQNLGTSLAAVGVGPVYLFRNVYYAPSFAWTSCVGVKTGENSTGFAFIYHNTFHIDCASSFGWVNSGNDRLASDQVYLNNILAVDGRLIDERIDGSGEWFFESDYNLFHDINGGEMFKLDGLSYGSLAELQAVATGKYADHETHSISGAPTFIDSTTSTFANRDYRLENGSLGIDAGVEIAGFNDANSAWPYTGAAPDMGAYEKGTDLAVSVSDDDHDLVVPGGGIEFAVSVTNHGADVATGVMLTNTLAGGASGLSGTWPGGSCSVSPDTATCTIGTMADDEHITVTITAVASSSAGTVTISASVSGNEDDPTPGNNTAAEATTVVLVPAVPIASAWGLAMLATALVTAVALAHRSRPRPE